MNAPIAHPYLVLLLDESGPLGSFWESVPLTPEKVVEVARAFFLKHDFATVLSMGWAEKPVVGLGREFHITLPGTHELPAKPPKRERKKRVEADLYAYDPSEEAAWDPTRWRRSGLARFAPPTVAAPATSAEVVVEPGPKCGCGIERTLAAFHELPLVSATDRQEGFTKIHDESRTCSCGAVLMFTRTRLVGG